MMRRSIRVAARMGWLLLVCALASCSKPNPERIFGQWEAEKLQVSSLTIPMGPQFSIGPNEIVSLDGSIRIPVSAITAKDDTVTLKIPAGIGLSFHFEGANRIFFELPFVDRIYFNRVIDTPKITAQVKATPTPPPATQPATPPVQPPHADSTPARLIALAEKEMAEKRFATAEAFLAQGKQLFASDPLLDYTYVLLRVNQGKPDDAIRHLEDALKHGFRTFNLLETSPLLAELRNDSRYSALIARYR